MRAKTNKFVSKLIIPKMVQKSSNPTIVLQYETNNKRKGIMNWYNKYLLWLCLLREKKETVVVDVLVVVVAVDRLKKTKGYKSC